MSKSSSNQESGQRDVKIIRAATSKYCSSEDKIEHWHQSLKNDMWLEH